MDDRLAVLIDAENAQPKALKGVLEEVSKLGRATSRRIYGDFTAPSLKTWGPHLLDHAIQPMQQFRNTAGKNASDSALIIDAMDLLHSGRFDGFCIVSSDSDFTRLASRIREDGLKVIGFGEKKTPPSFVSACDQFIYTENLRGEGPTAQTSTIPVQMIRESIEECSMDDGWANLGTVGNLINRKAPDFDPRTYGYQKLAPLLESIEGIAVERRAQSNGSPPLVFVSLIR